MSESHLSQTPQAASSALRQQGLVRPKRWSSFGSRVVSVYLPALLLVVFVVSPFLWMLLGSFKTNAELMSNQGQTLWIKKPTLDNYVRLFQEYPFARFFLNSTIVSTCTTLIAVSF